MIKENLVAVAPNSKPPQAQKYACHVCGKRATQWVTDYKSPDGTKVVMPICDDHTGIT